MSAPRSTPTSLEVARIAWGADLPDWVQALASEVDRSGVKATARKITMGDTTVWEVIRRKYRAATGGVETRVRAALMRPTVTCPELGEIEAPACLAHQSLSYSRANPLRVALYHACRSGCPHATVARETRDD